MRQLGVKALGIFLLGTILASCNLDSLKDPVVVAEVNNEFHIDLWENLSPSGDELLFQIQSIDTFDCENYTIDYSLLKRFREFEMSLNEIQEPGDCEAGSNTANVSIKLGTLNQGFYELNINLQNTVMNSGQLTVSSEGYLIEMEDAKGISFIHDELLRIPANTIWGYIVYDNEAIANDFIAELEDITNEKVLKKGYYGYFSIDNNNSDDILLNEVPEESYRSFLFEFDGTDNTISDLVSQFRDNHSQSIEIHLINDEGIIF